MDLLDTSEAARLRQLDAYRSMTGAEKTQMAADMAEQARATALAGIRARDPQLTEAEVHRAWLRLLHGDLADCLVGPAASEAT